ncbi:MAG TPA: hypothetical protein VFC56_09345 [Stellaceae bacterium]|nr:hypothetical protein [Stellaceae bacterium]
MAERLPPPPFWRTLYFEYRVLLKDDRRDILSDDVLQTLRRPFRQQRQADGRLRLWGRAEARHRWLRVIVEADGETVHNVFWDRNFRP